MTSIQLLLSIAGLFSAQTVVLVLYFNAKIDPVREQVNMLVQYMVSHEGKISRIEAKLGIKGEEDK